MFSSSPVASCQSKSSTSVSVELLFPFLASRYVFLSPSYSTQHVHAPQSTPVSTDFCGCASVFFYRSDFCALLQCLYFLLSNKGIPSPRLLIPPPSFHSLPQVLIHPLDLNLPLPAADPQINFSSSQLFPRFQLNISTDNWIPAPECLPSPQTQTRSPETVLLSTL